MIRVTLPLHLQRLADVQGEVRLAIDGPVTLKSVLDALERRYPVLEGTIRFHGEPRRRPMVRFFACGLDLSNEPPETVLPDAVARGAEPLMVVGAMAGG